MLKTRIKKHRNHINWKTSQHSIITAHRQEWFRLEEYKNFEYRKVFQQTINRNDLHTYKQKNNLKYKERTKWHRIFGSATLIFFNWCFSLFHNFIEGQFVLLCDVIIRSMTSALLISHNMPIFKHQYNISFN